MESTCPSKPTSGGWIVPNLMHSKLFHYSPTGKLWESFPLTNFILLGSSHPKINHLLNFKRHWGRISTHLKMVPSFKSLHSISSGFHCYKPMRSFYPWGPSYSQSTFPTEFYHDTRIGPHFTHFIHHRGIDRKQSSTHSSRFQASTIQQSRTRW